MGPVPTITPVRPGARTTWGPVSRTPPQRQCPLGFRPPPKERLFGQKVGQLESRRRGVVPHLCPARRALAPMSTGRPLPSVPSWPSRSPSLWVAAGAEAGHGRLVPCRGVRSRRRPVRVPDARGDTPGRLLGTLPVMGVRWQADARPPKAALAGTAGVLTPWSTRPGKPNALQAGSS
jgi:hypothetical protein